MPKTLQEYIDADYQEIAINYAVIATFTLPAVEIRERILGLLADGAWHDENDLLRASLALNPKIKPLTWTSKLTRYVGARFLPNLRHLFSELGDKLQDRNNGYNHFAYRLRS